MTDAVKSTSITNLDASPIVANTSGAGSPGLIQEVHDYVTALASSGAGSTYRIVRIPTFAKVQYVIFESEAQGAGKFNLSAYYSDSTTDGTPAANQGVIVPTTGDQFWASDIDCSSAVTPTDVTNESGNYTLDKRSLQLWSALGLSKDPGGFIDVTAVVHTTAVTTGTGKLGVRVGFIA